ncbi:MAG: hypothetical protein ACKOFX_07540 [Solirubrobacterales bacterium]
MNQDFRSEPIPRRRFGAWLVTGPVGRLVGFLLDFASELGRLAVRRLRRAASPGPEGR